MNEDPLNPLTAQIEPERYEFFERTPYHFDLGRRDFFKILGGGIVVVSVLTDALAQQQRDGRTRDIAETRGAQEMGAWLHIGEDGTVTAFTGKVELGQNIRTSLAQQVAEELGVRVSAISLVMGDTDLTPYDMGTFGSRTTPYMGPQLQIGRASCREGGYVC